MHNGDPAASRGSRLPRRVHGSSDIARAGKRASSASTAFWRSCNAGPPRQRARGGARLRKGYGGQGPNGSRRHGQATKEGDMPMTTEKAQVTLPSDREVKVTRSFKAARPLVYRAYTEPALVQRWLLGPPGWSMPVCEMDVRVGGRYRWRWRSEQDASEFGFAGTFREVTPPSRLVHTEAYDPGTVGDAHPQSEALVSVTFAEDGGITTVTTLIDFGSREARDAAVATGMTDGMEQSYQLLEALLGEGG